MATTASLSHGSGCRKFSVIVHRPRSNSVVNVGNANVQPSLVFGHLCERSGRIFVVAEPLHASCISLVVM